MKNNVLEKNIIIFFVCCLVAIVITFVGLRLYFNNDYINRVLTHTYMAKDLQVVRGKGENNTSLHCLSVDSNKDESFTLVNLDKIKIPTQFYQSVIITFRQKHPLQAINLVVNRQNDDGISLPILYTNEQLQSRFIFSRIKDMPDTISSLVLATKKIIQPYCISEIVFVPKQFSASDLFFFLLRDTVSDKDINISLLPLKVLLLIYVSIVGFLFALYLAMTKQSLIKVCWIMIIFAWSLFVLSHTIGATVVTQQQFSISHHINIKGEK